MRRSPMARHGSCSTRPGCMPRVGLHAWPFGMASRRPMPGLSSTMARHAWGRAPPCDARAPAFRSGGSDLLGHQLLDGHLECRLGGRDALGILRTVSERLVEEVRNELAQELPQSRRVASDLRSLEQCREPGLETDCGSRLARVEDLREARRHRVLLVEEGLLEELFAWTHAGEFDLDVASHLETAKGDEVLGAIRDLHRLAHVENEYFAETADGTSLHDELDRLGH